MLQRRTRPTAIVVFAVLHLVFGGFGVLGGLCLVGAQAIGPANIIPRPPPPPPGSKALPIPMDMSERLQKAYETEIPYYVPYVFTQATLGILLSVLMITAGVGLLFLRPWARRLSLVYGICSILFQLVGVIFLLSFLMPITNNFYRQMEREYPQAAFVFGISRMLTLVNFLVAPIGFVYPIIVLVLLTRPKLVAAFGDRQQLPDMPASEEQDFEPPSTAFTR
jgi:hypothetical protein